MTTNQIIKYLIFIMILFSTVFHYISYGAVLLAFVLLLKDDPKHILHTIKKEKSILLLLAALILSIFFSKVPWYSFLIGLVVMLHFMAYMVIVKYIDKENLQRIYLLLNIMGIAICIMGIYQYLTGNLSISKSWTDQNTYGNLVRIYSTLRNPNILATYLAFNISLSMSYFLQKKADSITAINIILSSACLILTYSRGGFLAFAAAMLFIALICKEPKAGLYLAVMVIVNFGFNALQSTDRGDLGKLVTDSSSLYRIEIWKASWDLFKSNAVYGGGLGSVSKLLSYSSDTLKGYIFHAHNLILHIMAETGLLGLSAFIALLMTSVKNLYGYRKLEGHREFTYLATGFGAMLTALLVHGMVDCTVLIPSRSLLFLIYIALFPALYNKVTQVI